MSALFALNANEEKLGGVSLHVIEAFYVSPGARFPLRSKFIMRPQNNNLKSQNHHKPKASLPHISFYSFPNSGIISFHNRFIFSFLLLFQPYSCIPVHSICVTKGLVLKNLQNYWDRWGASDPGNLSSSSNHPCLTLDSHFLTFQWCTPEILEIICHHHHLNLQLNFNSPEKYWHFRFLCCRLFLFIFCLISVILWHCRVIQGLWWLRMFRCLNGS